MSMEPPLVHNLIRMTSLNIWLAIDLPQQFLSAYLSTTEAFTSKSFLGNL